MSFLQQRQSDDAMEILSAMDMSKAQTSPHDGGVGRLVFGLMLEDWHNNTDDPTQTQQATSTRPLANGQRRALAPIFTRTLPFRTLVVVPRSHIDGTFERLCGASGVAATGQVKCKEKDIAQRAVQLDFRPGPRRQQRSLFVVWDCRVVHQGHTHALGARGWNPPLRRPHLFEPEEDRAWRHSLAQEGYVAVADVLPEEDVSEALSALLRDLKLLHPSLNNLGEVRERHLPPSTGNDLRIHGGLSHGEFAWYLRTHPSVKLFFERLFDVEEGTPLTGSVDVVALAPSDCRAACDFYGRKWLHLDYAPPEGRMWQATLQLFPQTVETGAHWERIGLMICKAPAQWTTAEAEHSLLASCVAGATSRATAGVTLGLLHTKPEERARVDTPRILPELNGVPRSQAFGTSVGTAASAQSSNKAVTQECLKSALRRLSPAELMRRFSVPELRRLLPPHVRDYISPPSLSQKTTSETSQGSSSSSAPSPAKRLKRYRSPTEEGSPAEQLKSSEQRGAVAASTPPSMQPLEQAEKRRLDEHTSMSVSALIDLWPEGDECPRHASMCDGSAPVKRRAIESRTAVG
eukprot:gnl/TRDRNA2_/TRDRNA2_65080_c0_seq1.p1 gnl/TRDRNA2_/TRDRNA2_65080_c0~~gnl/TRDRNA2_/TRDRNA2_65080_c0_seq1.p1  ORF type:complete len:576 (-),score=75.36 gnl/TRDRNA2_/TRDRNA2_65080_c0_seq1:42-1769(-)